MIRRQKKGAGPMLLFDKMHGLTVLLLMIFISFRIKETQGCSTINKTCEEIKQEDGHGFVHNCRRGSRIRVSENEITVAYSYPEIKYLRKGMTLNDTTFVMKDCNNLRIKCTFSNGGRAEDICMDFNIIEPPKSLTSTSTTPPPVTAPPPNDQLITGLCIGICLIMIIGCIVGSHCGFFKSCCQKKQKEETEDQKSPDSNMDNSRNITIEMNGIQPANGACNENEKNGTLESVKVQSAERETPPNLSPNHIAESDEENQAKDGGASVPERAITCRDMQRNLRDDPGGMNGHKPKGNVGIEAMQNGWTLGGRGPKEDETVREPLLPVQSAAIQPSNMSGEDKALVDKSCFDPGPINVCSVAQDTDVESAHDLKNINIY